MPAPRESDADRDPAVPDDDAWSGLLAGLEGDDWAAADARAHAAERRRRRGGHALLLLGALLGAGVVWAVLAPQLREPVGGAPARAPSLVLAEALADDGLWRPDAERPRDRALPALAVYALAHARRSEPSRILDAPLRAAVERLLAQPAPVGAPAPAGDEALAALLRGLALLEAGRSLDEPVWRARGRDELARLLGDGAPTTPGGRVAAWQQLARAELAADGAGASRAQLSRALGGPPGHEPVWRAAAQILARR